MYQRALIKCPNDRQTFLKKSLGTKDLKTANVRAKPIQAGFDRLLGDAEQLLAARPMRETLSAIEIKRMAEIHYAVMLDTDETARREGTGSEAGFQSIAAQLTAAGVEFKTPFSIGALPEAGLSAREVYKRAEHLSADLPDAAEALARGHTAIIREHLEELLDAYQINLDPKCEAYRRLAMAVLSAHVKALMDIDRRNGGEPIDTPQIPEVVGESVAVGGSLRDAFAGWDKERIRPEDTVSEYKRAVEMFIQLHGDLPVSSIKKSHARAYREALQEVPRSRSGELLKASLPELSAWGRKHPDAPRVSAGTVNKQMGAVQAIAVWGYANGVIPEDAAWADPFAKMRLSALRSCPCIDVNRLLRSYLKIIPGTLFDHRTVFLRVAGPSVLFTVDTRELTTSADQQTFATWKHWLRAAFTESLEPLVRIPRRLGVRIG